MEYTVQKLAKLAGISTRTLRYYDEIGLLHPARTNTAGYRLYGQAEVDILQQILFYRELGVRLGTIQALLTDPAFDRAKALKAHRAQLLAKRKQLDQLITNVDKTIAMTEGRITMSDKEKFEGFKQKMIEDNEQTYGKEIREKYEDDSFNQSNEKVLNMTPEAYEAVTQLESELKATLAEAMQTGDAASALAQRAAELHKQWLSYFWSAYNKEAHANLAQMYVDDARFKAYYDEQQPGTAAFLRDAIHIYTGVK